MDNTETVQVPLELFKKLIKWTRHSEQYTNYGTPQKVANEAEALLSKPPPTNEELIIKLESLESMFETAMHIQPTWEEIKKRLRSLDDE